MNRISRHQLFMGIAETFATRGTCPRAQVGCVIVADRHVISHGYNGAPAGLPHCTDVGCGGGVHQEARPLTHHEMLGWSEERIRAHARGTEEFPNGCTRAIHAEANAIAYAASQGVKLASSVMYTTMEPCEKCAQLIITAGITEVIYKHAYRIHDGINLLADADIPDYLYATVLEEERRANEDTEVR